MSNEYESVVERVGDRFTEEALKAQDGKKVPLTSSPGSPIIGEATLRYDPDGKVLMAECRVTDPKAAKMLRDDQSFIFKKDKPSKTES